MKEYGRSVDSCLHKLLHNPNLALPKHADDGLYTLLSRVRVAMPALTPCEVMCLTNVAATYHQPQETYSLIVSSLVRRGWEPKQAHIFLEGFREKNPEVFDLRLARLLTREQLQQTYTPVCGDTIADMLVDPTGNPVLYAMMYGNILEPIKLYYQTVAIPIIFEHRDFADGLAHVPIPMAPTKELAGHHLNYDTANRLYENITGGSLLRELSITRPHDHEYTPKIEEAVWQAKSR